MDCKKSGTEIELSERVETPEWSQHSRIRPSQLYLSAFLDLTWSSSIPSTTHLTRALTKSVRQSTRAVCSWAARAKRRPRRLHKKRIDKLGICRRECCFCCEMSRDVWFLPTFRNFQCQTLRTELCTSSKTKVHEKYRNLTNLKTFMKTVSDLKPTAICHNPRYLFQTESS